MEDEEAGEEYSFPWALIGHFEATFITKDKRRVCSTVSLTRAFIKDFELILASREPTVEQVQNSVEEMSLKSTEESTSEDVVFECAQSFRAPRKAYHKNKKNRKKKNDAIYETFDDYWNVASTFLIYSTWLNDFRDVMNEENQKVLQRQIDEAHPIYLIDQHLELLENEKYQNVTEEYREENPEATYEMIFEKHSEQVMKLTQMDFEVYRYEMVKRRAKHCIKKLENLGFVPGYSEESLPSLEVKKEENQQESVFDDLVYSIDDSYNRPQHNFTKEKCEEVLTQDAAENDEKKEINFNFDPKKEPHLVASNARNLYQNDPEIKKYFNQRRRLFSRIDEGIIMDREGWFSVTPEKIAQHIADRIVRNGISVVVDAFTGVGGNAIQFALKGAYVIAVDLDPTRLKCARHNAGVYGVEDYISFICADFFHIAATWADDTKNAPKIDAVFLSPPWGGPSYLNADEFDLATGCCPDGIEIFEASRRLTKNIAYFLPRTTKVSQLVELSTRIDGKCEIEQSSLNSKIKTITAYYGDLAA